MTGPKSSRTALQLRCPDGRQLGYAEYGDPLGRPLLFFHGWPGSRRIGALLDEAATRLGVRVVSPERPGYGLSSFQPGRGFREWTTDVVFLADSLGLDRFTVLGGSGGGPYALACAFYLPKRITTAGVASGNAPLDLPGAWEGLGRGLRFGMGLGRRAPWLLRLQFSLMARQARKNPVRLAAFFLRQLPPVDRAVVERYPIVSTILTEDYVEAGRQGGRGFAWDFVVMTRAWGFDLGAIQAPVHFWHGEQDRNVPVACGRAQARVVPQNRATFYPDEGHLAIYIHREDILRALAP